jgi:hypothetical protein
MKNKLFLIKRNIGLDCIKLLRIERIVGAINININIYIYKDKVNTVE